MSSETGEQVFAGKYRLIAELGRGGMAEVHLAVSSGPAGFNKLVVIKQLRQSLADDPEFLTMFLDEARLAARLSHPNVVHTYEVVAEGAQHFIAMEYLDGQPLHRIVRHMSKSGGLPMHMHMRILADALAGLHHAHELADYDGTPLGVVHRDATPQNIFVTYDGQTKVVDFGIAKALNSTSETRSGVIKGKIAYMSPEQSRSEPVDRRTDVFAVGVMLWEAVTGQRLWKGLADVTILQRLMMDQDPPLPSTVKAGVSPELDEMCRKALASNREDRFATALDLQNAIENYLVDNRVRVTTRDVGAFLSEKFATERAEIKTIIEAQLKTRPTDSMRMSKLPLLSQASSSPSVTIETANKLSMPPSSTSVESDSAQSGPVSVTTASSATLTSRQSEAASRPKAGLSLVVGAVVLAGLGAVGWGLARNRGGVVESPPPPVAVPSAAASVEKVTLQFKASPPEAQMFLDNDALGANPYRGEHARDGTVHVLRVEAKGFVTRSKELKLDSDIAIEVQLDREASEEKKKGDTGDRTAKGGSKGSAVDPRGGGKTTDPPKPTDDKKKPPGVKLDTDNPWK